MSKSNNGWQVKSLGEVAEFLDSQRIPVKEEERAKRVGPYPYYGANGQVGWIDDYIFDEPLVLLAEDGGNFGSIDKPIAYKITGKSWVNNHAHVLRAKSNCNIDYLHRVLSFYDLSTVLTGTTRQKLRKGDAEKIQISIPPLPIQKQIAEILEKADQAKQKRKEASKLTDEFLQSVFIEMFGDPVKNLKGWGLHTLIEVCTKITDGTHDTPKRLKEGIKFITGKNIRPFYIDFTDLDYVTEVVHKEIYRRCNPVYGDILYTNIGINVGTAVMNNLHEEFSMKNVALLKSNSKMILSRYLEHLLNNPIMKNSVLKSFSIGGAQSFLSLNNIKRIRIPVPPLPLQQQFSEIVNKTEALKEKQKQSEQELENLFQSLMQKAFKGELVK